jgi:hypothetical protein
MKKLFLAIGLTLGLAASAVAQGTPAASTRQAQNSRSATVEQIVSPVDARGADIATETEARNADLESFARDEDGYLAADEPVTNLLTGEATGFDFCSDRVKRIVNDARQASFFMVDNRVAAEKRYMAWWDKRLGITRTVGEAFGPLRDTTLRQLQTLHDDRRDALLRGQRLGRDAATVDAQSANQKIVSSQDRQEEALNDAVKSFNEAIAKNQAEGQLASRGRAISAQRLIALTHERTAYSAYYALADAILSLKCSTAIDDGDRETHAPPKAGTGARK